MSTVLTFAQAEAARQFARQHSIGATSTHAERRLMARQGAQAARAALAPDQLAIVDLLLIKDRAMADVVIAAKRSASDLEALYLSALNTLADHYEATGA